MRAGLAWRAPGCPASAAAALCNDCCLQRLLGCTSFCCCCCCLCCRPLSGGEEGKEGSDVEDAAEAKKRRKKRRRTELVLDEEVGAGLDRACACPSLLVKSSCEGMRQDRLPAAGKSACVWVRSW